MLGIVICTHSILAEGFKQTVEMFLGKQENFEAVGLFEGDSVFDLSGKITALLQDMGTEENLIFTDMFGASPSNAAALAIFEENAAVITGVNLSMLIEALSMRDDCPGMDTLLPHLTELGKDNIQVLTKERLTEQD